MWYVQLRDFFVCSISATVSRSHRNSFSFQATQHCTVQRWTALHCTVASHNTYYTIRQIKRDRGQIDWIIPLRDTMTRPSGAVVLTMRCVCLYICICMYSGASDDVTESECQPGHALLFSLTPGRCVRGKGIHKKQ